MKMFKNGAVALGLATMVGCATVDPLTVPQTERDLKTYTETNFRPARSGKIKLAVISQSIAHASDTAYDSFLEGQMESAVANNFANLGWFETVDREHGVELAAESRLAGSDFLESKKMAGAEYALVVKSSVSYVAKQSWKRTAYSSKARGAQIDSDFRLISIKDKTPVIVKKFRSIVDDVEKGNVRSAIIMASNMNAKKFARVVASRFLPEVKVLQTRGDGQYAQVAMGKNYQATPEETEWAWWPYKYFPLWYVKQTVAPAATVDFFTNEKSRDVNGKETIDQNVFARGTVISAENSKAWVEVMNHETAGVLKGHHAKVSELSDDGAGLE